MKKILPFLVLILTATMFGQEFSSDWTSVPKTFVSQDAKAVVDSLLKSPVLKRKDEFETTADYLKRLDNMQAISLGGKLNAESTLTFRLDASSIVSALNASYNADDQIVSNGFD